MDEGGRIGPEPIETADAIEPAEPIERAEDEPASEAWTGEERAGEEPAGEVPAIPRVPRYELPGARSLVGRGFDLSLRASGDTRRASLALGAQFLGLAGPVTVVFTLLVFSLLGEDFVFPPGGLTASSGLDGLLVLGGLFFVLGFVFIETEGSIVVAALLAGRLTDRPVTLREAILRSRQTFWRYLRARFLVGLIVTIPTAALSYILGGDASDPTEVPFVILTLAGVVLGAPFVYVLAGIVLGDVRARESLRRSIRLARARPGLALTVSLFVVVGTTISTFALGAGSDIVARAVGGTGVDLTNAAASPVVVGLVTLVLVMAVGTLIVTITSIITAPQIVAFVGLTWYTAGLEQARRTAPDGSLLRYAESVRVVSPPMIVSIVLAVVVGLAGIGQVIG